MQNGRVLAVVGTAALLLGACATKAPEAAPIQSMPAPDPALQKYYDHTIEWESCASDADVLEFTDSRASEREFTCAKVSVPLDYADPTGASIDLQLVRYSLSKNAKPLIFNPGGPGGSAVSALPSMVDYTFTDKLMREYDIVAVDPRGVGLSAPVHCLSDAEIDEERSIDTPITVDEIRESAREIGEKCLQNSPDMAKHSDSDSAMRDLDIVRAALGREKLDYFGFSYGTFLGALYADEFPDKVGGFVLDGAIDPALTVDEISEGQATGFENVLAFWMDAGKKAGRIPLKGDTSEMKAQLREWLDGLEDEPLETADPSRPLTRALATSAILSLMYDDATWDVAWMALSQAMEGGDGSLLLQIADLYADRNDDGTYKTNSFDAFNVVNGLDYKADEDEDRWMGIAKQIQEDAPLLGEEFSYGSAMMQGWPIESRDTRGEVSGTGAAPILVIGTTFDPATPYQWAQSLAKQLESGHLLTVDGFKHTAYSRDAGKCVTGIVDSFLIDGKVPADDARCELP